MVPNPQSLVTRLRRRIVHRLQDILAPRPGTSPSPTHDDFRRHQVSLERLLLENILPFWFPRVLDNERGGFVLNHDVRGQAKAPAPRGLVGQARTTWFFARLAGSLYGQPEHLDVARHGMAFLHDRLWDREHGGFFWEVDARGDTPTRSEKHLYGQSFGLLAVSEFASAAQDADALALARELFGILEERAHDPIHGGYDESFRADWSPVPEAARNHIVSRSGVKLLNTHLHLMEALTSYLRVTGDPNAQKRLHELVLVQSSAVLRKTLGACTDAHARDWSPMYGQAADVSYGHDLENVWMVHDTCEVLGLPQGPLADLYRTLFDYSLRCGFDHRSGGFFYRGGWNRRANRREKVWWVQAEAMLCALVLYRLTGDPVHYDVFARTLAWIEQGQADWEYGDWHAVITEAGAPSGDKASAWKAPYHNGRAVLRCLELLAPLSEGESRRP